MRWIGIVVGILLLLGAGFVLLASGALGRHQAPGTPSETPVPASWLADRDAGRTAAAAAVGVAEPKQILFGDLHVHTTFSPDAFLLSLPILQGAGVHPPADACDFARFCSSLDFWSLNDHAEGLTPRYWRESVETIRQCNAVDDDVEAFLGWEWTQVGSRPENHYGHKNVILLGTGDDEIPARPIAARRGSGTLSGPGLLARAALPLFVRDRRALELGRYWAERAAVPECPDGVPVRELPTDCHESVATPGELFAKLDEWGHEALVIPHGTSWGNTAPPGADWIQQLRPEQDDPVRQPIVEIYSGHGNAEEYREQPPADAVACPEPTASYLPPCWQAGEIIRERCLAAGEPESECDARAVEARAIHLADGETGFLTVPGARGFEWLDAGQCRDCFLPVFDPRPNMSVQYMMARSNFEALDDSGEPYRQRMGFIGSSDVHSARPGTGYKEFERFGMTDQRGLRPGIQVPGITPPVVEPEPRSRPLTEKPGGFAAREIERIASFLYTGGLVATHSHGRSREEIFAALGRREVYGTSGDRILLWFDLLNPEGTRGETLPMGSEATLSRPPIFRVRAVGAFEQLPGCPEHSIGALEPEALDRLCRGECDNPGDTRKRIERIEVVRVRPQIRPDEPIAELIEDPWKVIPCSGDPAGCVASFSDPDFTRDTTYYVRAIQEPTPAVNGATLRCTRDESGRCVESRPCPAADPSDACLEPVGERAWSSPIWVDHAG